jgi:signal peptidase I
MSEKKLGRRGSAWREFAILVVVALVVALVVRTFVAESFFIPSGSMEHTLEINDRVVVDKVSYDFHGLRRGDIVVFHAPTLWAQESGDSGDWIKRVIGVGGDRVSCCDAKGRLIVNGKPLDEPYIYHNAQGKADQASEARFSVTVPAGRLWLMGDHRSDSLDSRENYLRGHTVIDSTVPDSLVVGRAFVRYWPLSRLAWLHTPKTFDHLPPAREQ